MFGFEGLGCIYWHMVSKLLLVTGEIAGQAGEENPSLCAALLAHYDAIKAGIGAHKSPEEYGAFPTDPYSHTTGFSGVQQPGMTGLVKEELLSRLEEDEGVTSVRIEPIRRDILDDEPRTDTLRPTWIRVRADELDGVLERMSDRVIETF